MNTSLEYMLLGIRKSTRKTGGCRSRGCESDILDQFLLSFAQTSYCILSSPFLPIFYCWIWIVKGIVDSEGVFDSTVTFSLAFSVLWREDYGVSCWEGINNEEGDVWFILKEESYNPSFHMLDWWRGEFAVRVFLGWMEGRRVFEYNFRVYLELRNERYNYITWIY